MSLSNILRKNLDDFVNNSDKEDFISRYQKSNTASPQLLFIRRNKVVGHSIIEKEVTRRSKVADYSRIEQGLERDTNSNMSNISFFIEK